MSESSNSICKLFGIRLPIIQAGMVWCSGWRLAAAVSNAGGLGLIGAGSMTPELLREHIQKCRAATSRPFGVNLPLLYKHVDQMVSVILDEHVPIVFSSAGSPSSWTPKLKDKGITVAHVVSSVRFAQKAEEAGVDAIVAEGFEAGGHNGREETTTLVLVPLIRASIRVPLIAAGGIGSGKAMLATEALGAQGFQIGSRFAICEESSAHEAFKKKVVELGEGETQLSLKQLTPVRMIRNGFFQRIHDAEKRGASKEELSEILGRGRSRLGIFQGDLEEGELEIGQVSAAIDRIQPAAEIVAELWEEYEQTKKIICG